MKTPLNPQQEGLADASGTDSRTERDEKLRLARADTCATEHTSSGCSGTETLALIERALMRLSSGTYGICLSCGADIALPRLDLNPAIETCERCHGAASFKAH